MKVLSYQLHSGKYSPFSHGELLPTSKFRIPSLGNPTSRQSSISDQNKLADSVSQFQETDDVVETDNLKQALNPLPASRNSQENPIIVDDDGGDPTDRSNHTSHQVTVDNPGVGGKSTDRDAGGAAYIGEVVANSDLDDATMLQCNNRSANATSTSFSPKIPESDSGATMDEERQLHPSVQGDSIASPSGKRSCSLSGSGRADGRGSDWVFDVFAESDSRTEGDGSPSSKRARTSSRPTEAAKNRPSLTAAVKGVQMPGTAQADRSLQGDQEYKVHQVVDESGSEYEVTALTKMWLPKASVDPKLVRKYRAERRVATRVRTR